MILSVPSPCWTPYFPSVIIRSRINTHRLEGDMKWVLLGLAIGVFIDLGGFMIVLR